MDFTSDKLRSLVRKWQTLVDAHVDVKTTDGYLLRLFAIGFTKRRPNQVRKTTYAQTAQIREIRKKMFEIMTREASTCDLKELVQKFVPEAIGREIEKASRSIYPLQNVFIRKAKILKAPKFDLSKLMELHGESTDVSFLLFNHVLLSTSLAGDWHSRSQGLQGACYPRVCIVTCLYLPSTIVCCYAAKSISMAYICTMTTRISFYLVVTIIA